MDGYTQGKAGEPDEDIKSLVPILLKTGMVSESHTRTHYDLYSYSCARDSRAGSVKNQHQCSFPKKNFRFNLQRIDNGSKKIEENTRAQMLTK